MNATNISSSSNLYADPSQMNGMSGASSYMPETASTTVTLISQLRADIKQNSQDFRALKSTLHTGDLAGATQAFATLQADIQKASQTSGQNLFDPTSAIGKDFQAVGEALKAGDVSAAKQAFATFRQDIRSAGRAARAHHHVRQDGDGDDAAQTQAISNPTSPVNPPSSGGMLNITA